MDSSMSDVEASKLQAASQLFTTKLSLPKFFQVAKSLDPNQRDMVKSIGFHHLLNLSCTTLTKPFIMWLATCFDIPSRTFILPNGCSFSLSPLHIHQVLGIPIGGTLPPKDCDDHTKKLILEETKCAGNHPTINELKALITPDLDGDKFKRIFALFAISCFLCPTSSDSASPEFYASIHHPDKIISFDWCTVVVDKLVTSISNFQQASNLCTTAALGGCTFAIMILYFELLETQEIKLPEYFPRISIWSNDLVATFIELDRIHKSSNNFGRLRLRDISTTALCPTKLPHGTFINTSMDVDNSLQTILPGQAYSHVREKLQATYADSLKDLITAAKPILTSQILKDASIFRDNIGNSRVSKWPEFPFCTYRTVASLNDPVSIKLDESAFMDDAGHSDTVIVPGMQPPEIIDIHPGMKDFFEYSVKHLEPLDSWDGFDIDRPNKAFMDELDNLIYANETHTVSLVETNDQDELTLFSLANLGLVDSTLKDINNKVNIKEEIQGITEEPAPLTKDNRQITEEAAQVTKENQGIREEAAPVTKETTPLTNTVPLKKRLLPLSFSQQTEHASPQKSKLQPPGMVGLSLNEHQAVAMRRFLAARKKKLKFESSDNLQTLHQSSSNIHNNTSQSHAFSA